MQTGLAAATAGDCGWVTTENRLVSGQGGGGAGIDTGSTARVQRGEELVSRSGPTALNDPGEREKES